MLYIQVWTVILSEMESMVQLIRQNAEKLCTSTLESILWLINEKKTLRKSYADERAQLDQNLAQVSKQMCLYMTQWLMNNFHLAEIRLVNVKVHVLGITSALLVITHITSLCG